jgi:protein tyrosine/serine phosphatase
MKNKFLQRTAVAIVALLSFAGITAAQNFAENTAASISAEKKTFPNVKIGNFGQMDERLFRGAQPEESDYASLKELGVDTVVDLRNDPTDYSKKAAEAAGLKYVNIPMSGWKTPKMESINEFLALMEKPETGEVYIHCKAGKHRTGVIGAAYRYTKYGWDYDQVYKEMKDFNYSNGLVHGKLGKFVKEWGKDLDWQREQAAKNKAPDTTAATAGGTTSN